MPTWSKVRHSSIKQKNPSLKITFQPLVPPTGSLSLVIPQPTTALVGKVIQGQGFSASVKVIPNLFTSYSCKRSFSWTFSKWVPFYMIPILLTLGNTEISLGVPLQTGDERQKPFSQQEMGKCSDFVFLHHFAKKSWGGVKREDLLAISKARVVILRFWCVRSDRLLSLEFWLTNTSEQPRFVPAKTSLPGHTQHSSLLTARHYFAAYGQKNEQFSVDQLGMSYLLEVKMA